MGKSPSDQNGMKKGPWTPEEDQKLIDYIQKHGQGKWRTLPKNAGLRRCGKSCRLRWTNYLRPDIKRGSFALEEEQTIIQLHSLLGNKWSTIAARLPGRTDNEIKNYWNTHIKKKLLKMGIDPVTHVPLLDLLQLSSILSSPLYNWPQISYPSDSFGVSNVINQNLLSLVAALLSSQYRNPGSTVVQSLQNQVSNARFSSQHVQLKATQAYTNTDGLKVLNDQLYGTTSTTSTSCRPQFETPTLQQFSPAMANLSFQNNLPNLSQYDECQSDDQQSALATTADDSTAKLDSFIELLKNQILQPSQDTESFPSCSFDNLLSSTTSSSCPTSLNSTSTVSYVNGSVEDDRDNHSSNMSMYITYTTL